MRKILLTLLLALPLMAAAQTTAPYGIYVSQNQGTVDWPAVHEESDVDFVYVQVTSGATITDSRCGTNLSMAAKSGFPVGAVHRYDRHYNAEGQLANFQAAVKGYDMKLAPVVYVEPDNPYDLKIKRLDMLLQLMEQAYGVKPLIMCTAETYLKYFSLERYASFHVIIISNGLKFPSTRYSVWQYTDKEQVPGFVNYVPGLKLHPTYKIDNLKMSAAVR